MEKEMKAKWGPHELHEDTTQDYVMSDLYKVSKQFDQLQARVKELEGEVTSLKAAFLWSGKFDRISIAEMRHFLYALKEP